ncbi:XkdF-like putative serine protease domain-containing protein [Chitinophaga sp. sic0106]|uniref:XkdF-like putative serine protease domain-containing protein n=1 Tax=Chitinophaga sp. sic0106 TaxID=2854785 RepID=UPI001C476AF6|nr:XkdF-like putative serine protease domain-containing protein [Chitinophaga sp. sic0106]MBV7534051.1 hypothetical protein [Chitinophaga sp. sic0106]
MNTQLPIYQLTISDNNDDDSEVDFVSLVDRPAIQRNFLSFSEHQAFSIDNEDERIVTGPAMIPDAPIYRRDESGEFYVVFDADTINKIAIRFFKKGYQANINTMHERNAIVANSVFYESWVVDREKGKMPLAAFKDVPDGTWFLTAKINNDETWQKIKSGEYRGFSVEGLFDYTPVADIDPDEAVMKEITKILKKVGK